MKVGIVGGTGNFGRGLVHRLAGLGIDVAIGSRDPQRARELALVYGVRGGLNEEVVQDADLAVLAVRSGAALETARQLAAPLAHTPLLCVASDIRFTEQGVFPGRLGRALAEEIADVVSAPVVAGLHSLAAAHLVASELPDEDVLACGDDDDAKQLVLDLGARCVAGRAIDAGPLANARALEGLTSVILNVNKRYRVHAGVRITGLP